MLTAFLRAFRTPDLRRKLLFTVFIIAVFRLGSALPTPGVSESAVHACIGLANKNGGNVFPPGNPFSGGGAPEQSGVAARPHPPHTPTPTPPPPPPRLLPPRT